jgi:hypothetical protein
MFLALTLIINGQQNYQDVIYLKDNIIISGVILEQVMNKSVKIVNTAGDTLNYKMDEIEKLTREYVPDQNKQSEVRTWSSTGYRLIIEVCIAHKVDKYGMDFTKLNIINGIRLNRSFSVGFGIALRYNLNPGIHITSPSHKHVMISVFSDLRTYLLVNKKISGYFAFDAGYSFSKSDYPNTNINGEEYYYLKGVGILLNPEAGFVLRVSVKSALNIGIGYEMYKVGYDFSYYNGHPFVTVNGEKIVGSMGIKAGITF